MDKLSMALFIIVIIVILIVIIILLKKKRGIVLPILVGCLGVAIVGFLGYNTVFYNHSNDITIKNAIDEDFTVKLDNHLIQYEYTYAQFSSYLSSEQIQKKLETQYENVFFDKELNQISFSNSNQIYSIENYENSKFLWSDRHKYWIRADSIEIDINSENFQIPFPINAVHESVAAYNDEMKIKCDYEDLKEYYKSFSNVEYAENTIILAYDSYKISLVVEDSIVKVTIV